MKMKWMLLCWMGCAVAMAADVTTVEMTDDVVVADISRLGINLGSDLLWDGGILVKKRVQENFEGSLYRQCHKGELFEDGFATYQTPPFAVWKRIGQAELWKGADVTVISGEQKGEKRTVTEVQTRVVSINPNRPQQKECIFFVFDKLVKAPRGNSGKDTGILIQQFATNEGYYGMNPGVQTGGVKAHLDDVDEESFGQAAGLLENTEMKWILGNQRYGNVNGIWNVHFRAKAKDGSPSLTVVPSHGSRENVSLDDEWEKFELQIKISGVPEPTGPGDEPRLDIRLAASGGPVLIDDIEMWMEGDRNPTAFRDDVVNVLKKYNPGVLRKLQMGGNTIESSIRPNLSSYRFQNNVYTKVGPTAQRNSKSYSIHEFYELCEFVDSEAWHSVPGTLTQEETSFFMEYLGGSEETPGGKLRVELGHPKPWTETLRTIHVQFGNESWNGAGGFKGSSFDGPDYWHDLIETGKASPHFRPNILFHADGQNFNSGASARILRDTPNADRYAIAPYFIQHFTPENAAHNDTTEKLFHWALGFPISTLRETSMPPQGKVSTDTGIEFSIYEINYHPTHGTGSVEPRNDIVKGIGGGVGLGNAMLMLLKEYNVRTQCLFNFVKYSFINNELKKAGGEIRLWGTAISTKAGEERYRPTWLANELSNQVLGGDMVETVHSGQMPKAIGSGPFDGGGKTTKMTEFEYDEIYSYGICDGTRRGLILVNLSVNEPRDVKVKFSGATDGTAQRWLLAADSITAHNDYENDIPQVEIKEDLLSEFGSGTVITLPPHSMTALQWNVR